MGATPDRRPRWATPADAVVAAGAAVVLALLTAAFFVVEPGNGPSIRSVALQPDEAPAQAPTEEFGAAPPAVFGLPDAAAPLVQAPAYTRVAGVARVSAFGPAGGGTRLRPVCDYAWAPQVRLDDGAPAVVSVPGVLSGLVVVNGRATWNCDYTYRADVRTKE